MRIAILSLHLHTNFGGIVQAYALSTVLKRMGHEVDILDRPFPRYNLCSFRYIMRLLRRMAMKALGRKVSLSHERDYNRYEKTITRNTMPFVEANMNINRGLLNIKGTGDYDAFVVGSDQVWRKKYFCQQYAPLPFTHAFLKFTEGNSVKRIAYAPSFGTDEWELDEELTKECALLLSHFDAVSVREKSGVSLCKEHFLTDAVHVLDPTMLLEKSDYLALIEKKYEVHPSNNLFCYVLDSKPELDSIITDISNNKALQIVNTNVRTGDTTLPLEERVQRPVEEWLKGFAEAELVVTDSFHACVFSIIFNKPFVVVGNKSRGMARFESLLSMFGLEDRLVDVSDIAGINQAVESPIRWEKVSRRLALLRKSSLDFLSTSLTL